MRHAMVTNLGDLIEEARHPCTTSSSQHIRLLAAPRADDNCTQGSVLKSTLCRSSRVSN